MALAGSISAVLCDSLLNLLWRELPASGAPNTQWSGCAYCNVDCSTVKVNG